MKPLDKVLKLLKNCHVLDTETTGLNNAEVVEISIIDETGKVIFDSLVKPLNPIPVDATKIHGITNEMVKDAPRWCDIHQKVSDIIITKPLVIYNESYDLRVMSDTAKSYGLTMPDLYLHGSECAMLIYAELFGDWDYYRNQFKWQKLTNAAAQQHVEVKGTAHRALADCQMTLGVMAAICGRWNHSTQSLVQDLSANLSTNQVVIELKKLVKSEIGDFFAGFGHLSEPVRPEIMQKILLENIDHCFAQLSEIKQEDFSHEAAKALSNLTISSLDGIRHYVDHRKHELKRYLQELDAHLEVVDFGNYEALQKEASNLDNLSMVLSREVERVFGI